MQRGSAPSPCVRVRAPLARAGIEPDCGPLVDHRRGRCYLDRVKRFILGNVLALASLAALSAPAHAASVSGRITDTSGGGLEGMEVRLWSNVAGKGWNIVSTASTDAGGAYSFVEVEAGSYRLDARLPFLVFGNLGDRWFDLNAPSGGGWDGYAADILVLENETSLTAVDIPIALHGGLDGTTVADDEPAQGIWLRADRPSLPGVHHNVRANEQGRFSFRGLLPGEGYRLLAIDPDARLAPTIFDGPYEVTVDGTPDIGELALGPHAPDPYEPNDGPTGEGVFEIDSTIFRGESPEVFITADAYIGPRGEDVDWYCFNVEQHDRFLAYTITDLGLPGEVWDNPWVDPMLRFATPSGSVIDESDDAPGFGLNAAVDTGDVAAAGTMCVVVSMYGDTAWDGTNQQSAGEYTLVVELGNRLPTLQAFIAETRAPEPPGQAIVSEGELLRIDIEAEDPDGDPIDGWISHVDVEGNPVEDGTFNLTPDGRGSYTWEVPDDGARHAPYELTLTVSDGEFNVHRVVLIQPRGVNIAPEAPVPYAPANGTSVATWTPTLEVENAFDADGDILSYEFEVHYGDPSEAPDDGGSIGEDADGITGWTAAPIAENQRVSWRARARDGALTGGISPWTEFQVFVVNVDNEPPSTPVFVKPDDGATVPQRTPTLSAENTEDPDGDTQYMVFEVSTDASFTDIVRTSEPVEQNSVTGRTSWAVDPPLEWGATYYARAFAQDPPGATSGVSNVHQFRVKNNQEPERPELGGDFADQCAEVLFEDGAPSEFIVQPVVDPEGEEVTIDFRIYEYPGDLDAGTPVFAETVVQPARSEAFHTFQPDPSLFQTDVRYAIYVRADDGDEVSDWLGCDFWIAGDNQPPGAVTIISPTEGEILPESTTAAPVVIGNAVDPNGADVIELAWCAANLEAEEGCPDDITEWNRVDQSDGTETEFSITGVFPGAQIGLQVRAVDQSGLMGPVASVSFEIDKSKTEVTPSLCACAASEGRPPVGHWMVGGLVLLGMRRRRRG